MRNNKKTLGIFLIILGFIILMLIVYISFFANQTEPEVVTPETPGITGQLPGGSSEVIPDPTTTPGDRPTNNKQYDISQELAHQTNQADLIKMAEAFAERFGSYSNYSNYSNFSDLNIFMTSGMRTWAEQYVADLKGLSEGVNEYYGITTMSISSELLKYDNNAAEIVVTTQRRTNTDQVNEGTAYMQKIEISFKKIEGNWLVDKAYWQQL